MSIAKGKIIKAHQLVARCGGYLAIGLGNNKIGRSLLGRIALDLREAADLIDEVRSAQG